LKSTLDFNAPTGAVEAVPRRLCKRTSERPFWISSYTLTTTQSGRVAWLNGSTRVGLERGLTLPNVRSLILRLSAREERGRLCFTRILQALEAS